MQTFSKICVVFRFIFWEVACSSETNSPPTSASQRLVLQVSPQVVFAFRYCHPEVFFFNFCTQKLICHFDIHPIWYRDQQTTGKWAIFSLKCLWRLFSACRGQKRASEHPGLELQLGAGNWTRNCGRATGALNCSVVSPAPNFIFNHVYMYVQVWPSTHICNAHGSQKRVSISWNWSPFVRAGEPEALILVLSNSATSWPQMVLTKWLHSLEVQFIAPSAAWHSLLRASRALSNVN